MQRIGAGPPKRVDDVEQFVGRHALASHHRPDLRSRYPIRPKHHRHRPFTLAVLVRHKQPRRPVRPDLPLSVPGPGPYLRRGPTQIAPPPQAYATGGFVPRLPPHCRTARHQSPDFSALAQLAETLAASNESYP